MKEDDYFNELEEFINKNRDQFDDLEPSPKVWTKINQNLPKQNNWIIYTKRISSIAALLIIGFFISELRFIYKSSNIETSSLNDTIINNENSELFAEFNETEIYYTQMVNTKINELKVSVNYNGEIEQEINLEMNELDSIYSELKNDLKDNIDNQEVINAMIQNYRIKLEILEDISRALNNNSPEKTNNYEM